jgi:threonine dehydrogenase-like Zn-dependent dehydrogenase
LKALVKYKSGEGNMEIRDYPIPEPEYGVDGAFVDYIKLPASLPHRIPESTSLEEAALRCLSMLSGGKVLVKDFIQDIYPLEQWDNAFEKAGNGDAMKVLIKP